LIDRYFRRADERRDPTTIHPPTRRHVRRGWGAVEASP
jgi:hypothetical protein